jgi:hypothetical protein
MKSQLNYYDKNEKKKKNQKREKATAWNMYQNMLSNPSSPLFLATSSAGIQ